MIRTSLIQFAFATVVIGLIAGLCGCDIADIVNILDDEQDDGVDIDFLEQPIPMDIGLVLPVTGEYAAPYGQSMERGFLLARDEINASRLSPFTINFVVEDDMSTAEGMVAAFERLVVAEISAIVGIVISTHAEQAFPIGQANQIVTFSSVSSAAGLSSIGDYIFRAALATDRMSPAGVNATHAVLGYERAAMIYDDADVWSTSSNWHLTAALLDLGVEVTATETFQTGDTDFKPQLTAIMELNPDALFISALSEEVVNVMRQGREIGIESQYIAPELGMNEIDLAGAAAEGVITFTSWHSASDNPINQTFVVSYESAYGIAPDPWAAQSYTTLHILFAGMVTALGTNTEAPDSTAIRDALATVENMNTNLGSFSFDPNGEAVYEPVVLTVRNGNIELFGDSAEMSP